MSNAPRIPQTLAAFSAMALACAGVTLVAAPAHAADLGTVATEVELIAAINGANAAPGDDSFTFTGSGFSLTADLPVITDSLTITGPGSASFTLDAATFDAFVLGATTSSFDMSGVAVTGAGTTNSTYGVHVLGTTAVALNDVAVTNSLGGLLMTDGSVTAVSSSFTDNTDYGIDIDISSSPGGSFDDVDFSSNGLAGANIDLYGTGTLLVTNSTADDNGDTGFDIEAYDDAAVTFTDTSATDNSSNGYIIWAEDDATLSFTNTTSTFSGSDGIQLDTYNRVVANFTNTTATDNVSDGIESDTRQHGSLTMTGVVASNNGSDGVDLEAYLGNVVTATNITANDNGGAGVEIGSHNDDSIVTMSNVSASGNSDGAIIDEVEHGGDAVLRDATFSGNTDRGILIDNESADSTDSIVTIQRVTSSGNGSGLLNGAGLTLVRTHGMVVNVLDSTFSGNSAQRGGGVYARLANSNPSSLNIVNSTISGNTADTAGAIHLQSGDSALVSILNSTVTNNTTTGVGGAPENGAVYLQGTSNTIRNSILAGNSISDLDIDAGTALVIDFSLIQLPGTDAGVATAISAGSDNLTGVSAALAPLANNGGTTLTHAPLSGSPAVNTGDPAYAGTLTTDQRGQNRIVGIIDMGAIEVQPFLAATGVSSATYLVGGVGSLLGISGLLAFMVARRRQLAYKAEVA